MTPVEAVGAINLLEFQPPLLQSATRIQEQTKIIKPPNQEGCQEKARMAQCILLDLEDPLLIPSVGNRGSYMSRKQLLRFSCAQSPHRHCEMRKISAPPSRIPHSQGQEGRGMTATHKHLFHSPPRSPDSFLDDQGDPVFSYPCTSRKSLFRKSECDHPSAF